MTGYGEARRQADGLVMAVEVRAINARYFKLSYRATEGYAALERRVEAAIRRHIHRGTVQLQLRVDRPREPDDYRINGNVIEVYRRDLAKLASQWGDADGISLDSILGLPGVVEEVGSGKVHAEEDWPLIESCLVDALKQLAQMRADEGASLAADLAVNGDAIVEQLDAVATRAPTVITEYQERLTERVDKALAKLQVSADPSELIREVSLFSERADISEEIVRLRSHLQQFSETLENGEAAGRKLEFIAQEMGREINTIGSKANDTWIARHVVEMKAALERIREQVQNVE